MPKALALAPLLGNVSSGGNMQRFFLIVSVVCVIVLGATVGLLLQDPAVSTFEIDRDRASIASELSKMEAESEKYSGGLLKSLIEIRIAMQRNALAMLDQKKASFVRRISLNYTIEGKSIQPASDADLSDILEDLSQAEKKASASRLEAEKYSGGLLQSMALIKAETDKLSVSQLRLKFYSAKHGIPMPFPAIAPDAIPKPPGTIVKDRDAL
jgi:hypothetical protein